MWKVEIAKDAKFIQFDKYPRFSFESKRINGFNYFNKEHGELCKIVSLGNNYLISNKANMLINSAVKIPHFLHLL